MMKIQPGVVCALVLALASSLYAQTPTEKAEKRLAELLAPGGNSGTFSSKPIAWPAPKGFSEIALPIAPYIGLPVRLPLPVSVTVKPRPAPEAMPLVGSQEASKAPKEVELPTKPLIRLPSLNVAAPAPIPILAQPTRDRASLAEPAFEASLWAALKPFSPVRDRPVPFVPLNLPDPFEFQRYGPLRNPPEENATPPAIPLQKPTAK
jgi:hypothetical protein